MCRQNIVILSLNSKLQAYIFLTKIIVESVVQKVRNLTYKENKMKKQERKKKAKIQKKKTHQTDRQEYINNTTLKNIMEFITYLSTCYAVYFHDHYYSIFLLR